MKIVKTAVDAILNAARSTSVRDGENRECNYPGLLETASIFIAILTLTVYIAVMSVQALRSDVPTVVVTVLCVAGAIVLILGTVAFGMRKRSPQEWRRWMRTHIFAYGALAVIAGVTIALNYFGVAT